MTELVIERMNLQVTGGTGHEHRVEAIARRAVALLGERLVDLGWEPRNGDAAIPSLSVPAVTLDLARTDDETCARALANSVLDAVCLQVGG